jgi:hypothetical protein
MSNDNKIDQICEAILELAATDIVSIAEVRQVFDNLSCSRGDSELLTSVLFRMLAVGVEIGHTDNKTGSYVEFIGWHGSPETKIKRAVALISSDANDAEFGVWLALRSNVDRYET